MAFAASMVSSGSPLIRSSPSRLVMVTWNSASMRRIFSSKEPKMFTACSIRSMLIRCSILGHYLYSFGISTNRPICSRHSADSSTRISSPHGTDVSVSRSTWPSSMPLVRTASSTA